VRHDCPQHDGYGPGKNEVADLITECDALDAPTEQTPLRGNVRDEFYAGLCQETESDTPVPEREERGGASRNFSPPSACATHQCEEER
jgi:hypothetical protein